MKYFIGIDLGTTNSAICSYNGIDTRVWKSPEQNDVTPSVIFFDRRGNKYVGKRAYDSAPSSPDNAAMLFKRLMGTSTPVHFPGINDTKTPEECSSEVLKILFSYLPEEIRNDKNIGTVITVPAAFNQMQKDATMQAANMAGLGNVALMQEPVAAVMSVMRSRKKDGIFLIYDLGGGTLDIAIAESIGGRVSLLAHGGIAMCGGRDFDRSLIDNIVRPWLLKNFDLPKDLSVNPKYKSLMRLAGWAAERAKIELSAKEEVTINLSEDEVRSQDNAGNEIYLEIPLSREVYNQLIDERVIDSIKATREALDKAGLTSHDLEDIVFVGGPTNYKPLRDKVAFELGVQGNTDVNPMTAVAEGASVFAESIDWASENNARKSTRGEVKSQSELGLSFNYIARTPDKSAKVAVLLQNKDITGFEFQIDSINTGWTSGRLPLKNQTIVELNLGQIGENNYKISVFSDNGSTINLEEEIIVINRTTATIDAIPASHSIGIEVLEKLGGTPTLEYLVRCGDSLPKKGQKVFKAGESLKGGSMHSLNFKLWEGEITKPISDNRSIGILKVSGTDFDEGIIPAGATLECDFEVLDSGNIIIEVSVPCIGATFRSGKNFYSRQEGQLDYTSSEPIIKKESAMVLERIEELSETVIDNKLDEARRKIEKSLALPVNEQEPEKAQEAMENILEAKKLLAEVRNNHSKEIRQLELNKVIALFDINREHASPAEASTFDALARTAQKSIDRDANDFEQHLEELNQKNIQILFAQDTFIIALFANLIETPEDFFDQARFVELRIIGEKAIQTNDTDRLRQVIALLFQIRIGGADSTLSEALSANIVRG